MPLLETRGAGSAKGFGLTGATAAPVYIEDVFSTWLYTGNGTSQRIVNGIDLAGKGGMVWMKARSGAFIHALFDTNRGTGKGLSSNSTDAETLYNAATSFNNDGFGNGVDANASGVTYASWTFRKQPKFFDVVTYTGTGSARTVAHSLGSVPGCIIVKRLDSTTGWFVRHRSLSIPNASVLRLDGTDAAATAGFIWNNQAPTSTTFPLGTDIEVNASGGTYVAYLFAHDAGGFGLTGTDNVISCGSFTTDANGDATVNLGYEPQWILTKSSSAVDDWELMDSMRGMPAPVGPPPYSAGGLAGSSILRPNLAAAQTSLARIGTQSTGFVFSKGTNQTYIYIAIRRAPMKTPTTGTSVLSPVARAGTGSTATVTTPGFPPDMLITARRDAPDWPTSDRLRGATRNLGLPYTQEETQPGYMASYDMLGATFNGGAGTNAVNGSGLNYINYFFRRAPGFFDVVCYTQNFGAMIKHNLGVVPELVIYKNRSNADGVGSNWVVTSSSLSTFGTLNSNTAWSGSNTVANTATEFWDGYGVVYPGQEVAYLFASCPGVSRVGSYTGNGGSVGTNGSSQTINCGFTGGARFVLIKCTSHTGGWFVFDSARGIVSGGGADPYLLLNSTAAENASTDSLSANSTGFVVNQTTGENLNVTGRTYLYLAIA